MYEGSGHNCSKFTKGIKYNFSPLCFSCLEEELLLFRGTRWLRHCATSRKVAGSIPDDIIGIFHWYNPSGRTTSMSSTQPLTEMSTGNISMIGKHGRYTRLTTLPPSYTDCHEIWELQPPGTLRASPEKHRNTFTFNTSILSLRYVRF